MFKLSTASLFAVFTVTATSIVAQSIPRYDQIPSSCATDCASTVEASYLCYKGYTTGQDIVSCFCSGMPSDSDISTCSSCLSSNSASELADVLSAIPSACGAYQKSCQKECGFDTCGSSDIACQCSQTYLASIYQCASCNTKNNNVGATVLADYEALAGSCGNQNYTVPATTSSALPSPTGRESYTAPSLAASASSYITGGTTVTGFAISTDGSATTVPVSTSQAVGSSSLIASSGAVAGASSATIASGSATAAKSGVSSAVPSTASAAVASKTAVSGAMSLEVNAVGVLGALIAAVALF